jgi:copper chaperone
LNRRLHRSDAALIYAVFHRIHVRTRRTFVPKFVAQYPAATTAARFTSPTPTSPLPMPTQTFKTTINCGNCVRAVTPILNAEPAITAWHVDTTTPDKLLTVTGDVSADHIEHLLEEAGFDANVVR